ncbi:MAG: hypothetical protein Q7T63_02695, partial [Burkholderiaceae bacterium]|nr:hypothetical protein [Burkholderiaceae bacterium]
MTTATAINLFDSPTFEAEVREGLARWALGLPMHCTEEEPYGSPLPLEMLHFQDLVSVMVWVIAGRIDTESTLTMVLDRTDTRIRDGKSVQRVIVERFAKQIEEINRTAQYSAFSARGALICKELGASGDEVWYALSLGDGRPYGVVKATEMTLDFIRERVGNVKLKSFYAASAQPNGFRAWREDFFFTAKGKSQHHRMATSAGGLDLYITKYNAVEPTLLLTPYEWHASIAPSAGPASPASRPFDAIACGMVYKARLPKSRGRIGTADLMLAADEVTDVDAMLAGSFLQQHPDAKVLLQKGDIAFVWLWERHCDASKGVGTVCIRVAIEKLIKEFPELATVVVDINPYQFLPQGSVQEPLSVQSSRLAAMVALQEHVTR